MNILTQQEWLHKAEQQFDQVVKSVLDHSQKQARIDQVERSLFSSLLQLGLTLLKAFVAGAGKGDEGPQMTTGERTLKRSEEPHQRWYRSIFGKLPILRWVYARGAKKKIEHAAVDAQLGLPHGEYSYVLEDWLEQLCVKETFGEGVEGLAAVLGVEPSVETAEELNQRMAQYAEPFRLSQTPEPIAAAEEERLLVTTADGTSVPMHRADRTEKPDDRAEESRRGSTRRAYVGAVYEVEPFVRDAPDVLDEVFRKQAAERRPRPQQKRLWAEMASTGDSLISGAGLVFVEMAIDVSARDPDRQATLVCLMDGERKLWDLQSEWLGRSVEVLDFYHALSRVRQVAKVVHADDDGRQATWVEDQALDLLTGRVETVIRRWRRLLREAERNASWPAAGEEVVRSAITYYRNNRHRMPYDEYLSSGYPIGSGIAEGGCRNLVKDRMDCTGMHWRLAGARAMLKTRALYLNGEWDAFIEYRIRAEQQELYYQNPA